MLETPEILWCLLSDIPYNSIGIFKPCQDEVYTCLFLSEEVMNHFNCLMYPVPLYIYSDEIRTLRKELECLYWSGKKRISKV